MLIRKIVLSDFDVLRSAKRLLQSRPKIIAHSRNGNLASLRLYVSPRTENGPARFARCYGVVSRIVGEFDNGSPAFEALKLDF